MQIDWFKVIIDIERAGMTQQQIAQTVHVSKSALYGWKAGAVPRYDDGEALIRLWELVTNRAPQEIPYTRFFKAGTASAKVSKIHGSLHDHGERRYPPFVTKILFSKSTHSGAVNTIFCALHPVLGLSAISSVRLTVIMLNSPPNRLF